MMPFDMNAAWRDTSALLQGNKELLLVIAGLFFFIPALALAMFVPDLQRDFSGLEGEAAMRAVQDVYLTNAHWLALQILIQSIGMLAMLALLRSAAKPTVGAALTTGFQAILPYLGAQILLGLGIGFVLGLPLGIAGASGIVPLVFLVGLVAMVLMLVLMVKFSMAAPVMAIERVFNPITAIQKSWKLTKGHTLRVFLFYMLVFVAMLVIAIVLSLFGMLLLALGGGAISEGIVSSLISAVFTTVFVAVVAATYRQLSGEALGDVGKTFD